MKLKLFLNTRNEAEDINTLSDGRAIHRQKTNGNPQRASPMQIKSYPHIRRSTNSSKQAKRFINQWPFIDSTKTHSSYHHYHHHHSPTMPSTCPQCSVSHTSAKCPLDLLAIYKSIVDSINNNNPAPDANKSNNDYAWDDTYDAQLKRDLKPPTLAELTQWFEEPTLVDHLIKEYSGVWDTKTREDLVRFKEVRRTLQKIQFQIEHLEALHIKETKKAECIVDDLSWVGFSGWKYKLVKELRKVNYKKSISDPKPNASSSARFSPYNKRPTLAQQLSSPPSGSSSNPIVIDIFTIQKPQGF